jgi:4-alpha-glucanotransferase
MNIPRSCGVILHPLSLSGPWLCGTMGEEAHAFVDFCAEAGIGWWQVLPLGPTAYGDSPYQSPSAFAGNPYLIDPRPLIAQGLLTHNETESYRMNSSAATTERIDYAGLFAINTELMDTAWGRFKTNDRQQIQTDFGRFCATNAVWLDDYALFAAIKETEHYHAWNEWPQELRFRKRSALSRFSLEHEDHIGRVKFSQFLFFSQWQALKDYAHAHGVKIIGDIPIFAAYDSADVWAHPELFRLDHEGVPTHVAGVPPDYFTATGQLWGNPLYNWPFHAKQNYAWWIERVRHSFRLVDALRIDHFRGFEAYWAVPAGEPTAEHGRWEKGPGYTLFNALKGALGELPIIAEDLGFITPEVIDLRDGLGFPGMRILQFAFEPEEDNPDYPHNYPQHCIAYTGTHDNDTSTGWLESASPAARARALAYTNGSPRSFCWDMIRTVWASPACIAVAPAQDLLALGSEARMNFPGRQNGYWTWRMRENALSADIARRLRSLSETYFRVSGV